MRQPIKQQCKHHLLAIGFLLGATTNLLGQGPTISTIDFPGATTTTPWGINTRGDIVGFYVGADKLTHGFLLSGDQYSTIEFRSGLSGGISGINAQGDISGTYSDGGTVHAFLLSDGDYNTWDVPGATYTNTSGLNARGDIAGRYVAGGVSHGYVLIAGQFNTIDFPGSIFSGLTSINQRRDILGRYRKADGVTHGFLLVGFQPACVSTGPPSLINAPALLSLSGDGRGQGAIQHSNTFQVASASNPAVAGELLSVYFTGLVDGGLLPPQITIGGLMADILFFGNTPGYPGLNQANVRVPVGVLPGAAVPVRLTYLDRTSNEVTIGVR